LTGVANRYASQQRERCRPRALLDVVVACAPMTSLVTGLGLAAAGYLVDMPGVAATGAVVCAAGLYVERLQARALRRRRRAERMRSRHEVTELRRTIAQLRQDVDAFHRALLDTEAALSARSLPLLVPVAPPAAPAPVPAVPEQDGDELVVLPLAEAEARDWVQTPVRDTCDEAGLPAQRPSPFVAAVSGSLPILPVPHAPTTDALVYAALEKQDVEGATRSLAQGGDAEDTGVVSATPSRTVA
jgi:hypothetical protein